MNDINKINEDNETNEDNEINKSFENPAEKCYQQAIKYLARQEYSSMRLQQKLIQFGFELAIVEGVIESLKQKAWLNDERFTEMLLNRYQAYGLSKLRQVAKKHFIEQDMFEDVLNNYNNNNNDINYNNNDINNNDDDQQTQEFKKACIFYEKKFLKNIGLNQQEDIDINDNNINDNDNDNDNDDENLNKNNNLSKNNNKNIYDLRKIQQKTEQKLHQKKIRYLIQKGFDYQTATAVIKHYE